MAKTKQVNINKEFHRAVKTLARETAELFKDDKYARKLLRKGSYDEAADFVFVSVEMLPESDNDAILSASEEGVEGLLALAVDASYADNVLTLAAGWAEVQAAMAVLPSLTWPGGIK